MVYPGVFGILTWGPWNFVFPTFVFAWVFGERCKVYSGAFAWGLSFVVRCWRFLVAGALASERVRGAVSRAARRVPVIPGVVFVPFRLAVLAVSIEPWRTRSWLFCVYDVCGVRCLVRSSPSGSPPCHLGLLWGSSGPFRARLGSLMWAL